MEEIDASIPTVIVDPKIAEKEQLIENKKRELAIEALKFDGVLDSNGDIK